MLHDLFQSTHPSGVRPYSDDAEDLLKVISIHAPQWGATSAKPTTTDESEFQSTHPSGVRLLSIALVTPLSHFNPRTPVGCDVLHRPIAGRTGISIHAPQWGATHRPTGLRERVGISIHAPQWGATRIENLIEERIVISIHAPQWGATTTQSRPILWAVHFNPRTPVGCDWLPQYWHGSVWIFQSTHPSGVRPREWA